MWKQINCSSYFLQFTHEHGYEICITDYLSVWSTFFTEEEFLSRLKETNELIKFKDEDEYVNCCVKILSNPSELVKHSIKEMSNGNELYVSITVYFGYPFIFQCTLTRGSVEFFYQKITQQLLRTIKDLRSSQYELRELMKKKDKEINEYKEEGGEIFLRHLKTPAFNDEHHMRIHKMYESTFGDTKIPTYLVEKSVDMPQICTVKQERTEVDNEILENIKKEPETPVMEHEELTFKPAPVSCKQEVIKTEPESSLNSPRKRIKKLNY